MIHDLNYLGSVNRKFYRGDFEAKNVALRNTVQKDLTQFSQSNYHYAASSVTSLNKPFALFYFIGFTIYNFFSWIKFKLNQPSEFKKVSAGIYRGQQPNKKGFDLLAHQRFRTILNFSNQTELQENINDRGFNYLFFPFEPSSATRQEMFDLINTIKNCSAGGKPLYFYSSSMDGKIEFVTACIRFYIDKWPVEKILKELGQGHVYYSDFATLFGPVNLADTLD